MSDEHVHDSTEATLAHSRRVGDLMREIITELAGRSVKHDLSKTLAPEKAYFDEYTPKLRATTYGSPEYAASLQALKPALDHHYANNPHHPEHYGDDGINGMTLADLVEMLADWKASGERHAYGSLARSLQIQQQRFAIDEQLMRILQNTARHFGWLDE